MSSFRGLSLVLTMFRQAELPLGLKIIEEHMCCFLSVKSCERPHWKRGHLGPYMSAHHGGKYLGMFRAGQAETSVKGPPGLSFSEKARFLGLWPLLAFEWRHWLFLREDG